MNRTMPNAVAMGGALLVLGSVVLLGLTGGHQGRDARAASASDQLADDDRSLTVQYLEIVTPEADATCALLAATHGVTFGDPVPGFGNARTARLHDGRLLGVRAPMRETEAPVVRPYLLVEDIDAAIKAAENAGAEIAIPPLEIPGQGRFAIYLLGGIDHGLWEF